MRNYRFIRRELYMDPFSLLKQAVKAVPAIKYAVGVAGIAAVVAIVLGLKLSPQIAVFGSLIVIALMFVLLVFSRFAGQAEHNDFIGPAKVLVWFYTFAIIAATCLFTTNYFFHIPTFQAHAPTDLISGNVTVYDGFKHPDQSTFSFATRTVGFWRDTDADLGVATPGSNTQASLFLANNQYPYTDPKAPHQDPANAGIIETQEPFDRVKEAPSTGYKGTYFDPKLHHVYCVRTRDGQHFAKIIITSLEADRISFDYVFQPDGSRNLASQ